MVCFSLMGQWCQLEFKNLAQRIHVNIKLYHLNTVIICVFRPFFPCHFVANSFPLNAPFAPSLGYNSAAAARLRWAPGICSSADPSRNRSKPPSGSGSNWARPRTCWWPAQGFTNQKGKKKQPHLYLRWTIFVIKLYFFRFLYVFCQNIFWLRKKTSVGSIVGTLISASVRSNSLGKGQLPKAIEFSGATTRSNPMKSIYIWRIWRWNQQVNWRTSNWKSQCDSWDTSSPPRSCFGEAPGESFTKSTRKLLT